MRDILHMPAQFMGLISRLSRMFNGAAVQIVRTVPYYAAWIS